MKQAFQDVKTIGDVHRFYHCEKPKHPLITIINLATVKPDRPAQETLVRPHFYSVVFKQIEGKIKYGRSYYDFEEGTLIFSAPNQVISSSPDLQVKEGWGLYFHPDLLAGTALGKHMHTYSFFHYDVNEALHISEEEKQTLLDIFKKIQKEYEQNIDRHTQGLIIDNLQLLLNYCNRFYDRQFMTRTKVNNDVVQSFEQALNNYFADEALLQNGLPDGKYFAQQLHLSPNYLSDLLRKYTGKTTQEHVYLKFADTAKSLLLSSGQSISEIAFGLGFEHPSHFTKLFKAKTGSSPRAFRQVH